MAEDSLVEVFPPKFTDDGAVMGGQAVSADKPFVSGWYPLVGDVVVTRFFGGLASFVRRVAGAEDAETITGPGDPFAAVMPWGYTAS